MVSAPSPTTTTSWNPTPWPSDPGLRVALRLLLGLPLVVLAVWVDGRGWVSDLREQLLDRAADVTTGGGGFEAIGSFYPPVPMLAAVAFGSAVGLGVLSSFLAGTALHAAWERMVRREVPITTQVALIASVVLVPAVWYTATQSLTTIGGLALLVVGMDGFVRFVFAGETSGGFTAGLMLAAAFLFDPVAVSYALTLAMAAPLIAVARYRSERGVTVATIAVLCFPIAAVIGSWAFLEWRFAGTVFDAIQADLAQVTGTLWERAVGALGETGRVVVRTPTYLAVGAILILRRPLAALGYVLPLLALALSRWAGLTYGEVPGIVLLSFLAMVSVPYRPGRRIQAWLIMAAIAQFAINVAFPPAGPEPGWFALF
jgi:hypothetical protein